MNAFNIDVEHETKRTYSFHRLNEILSNCAKGICPTICETDQYHLIDISIDGFVLDRSYYFFTDGLYGGALEGHLKAKQLIKNVYDCPQTPNLDSTTIATFESDYLQLYEKERSVKNRKAFWRSMKCKYQSHHDPYQDYCKACEFIERMKWIHEDEDEDEDSFHQISDFDNLRAFIEEYSHIANGMDLLRLCYLRHKIGSK